MTRRRHLGLALAAAAMAVLLSQPTFAAARPQGDESELRAFQRSKQPADVLRGRFADHLEITDSRRIATYVDRRGRRATLYVAKGRLGLCQVLVKSSSPGGIGGGGGGCSPRADFLNRERHVAASSGRLFAGVVANEVARVVIVGSRGVRHPVRVTADGGFIYDCRAYNGCAGLIACVEAYARDGTLLSGQPRGAGRVQAPIVRGRRLAVAALTIAALTTPLVALAAHSAARPAAASCETRPIVDRFVRAFNSGDLTELDSLFAQETDGWSWYAVGDRAGRRSLAAAKNRLDLIAYFDQRHRQHESLRIVDFKENSGGNFEFALIRRADDLADGRRVRRLGKGRVICEDGTLGVWSLGGRPRPAWFGRCPAGALPLSKEDVPAARAPVMWFVRNLLTELGPELDIRGARAVRAELATRTVRGGYAKIKCGAATQRRTVVVFVQLPAMAPSASMSSAVFYTSRTARGWVVWYQIH